LVTVTIAQVVGLLSAIFDQIVHSVIKAPIKAIKVIKKVIKAPILAQMFTSVVQIFSDIGPPKI